MSSILEGLRQCTSRAICSTCNRQPPGTFEVTVTSQLSMCPSVMFVFANGNGKFVFISTVLFTEEGDIEQNKETK